MSTLKTHNLQSPDAGSVNIALAPNAGMIVAGISTFSSPIKGTSATFSSGQVIINSSGTESGTNTKLAVCATGSPGSNPSSITNNVVATFRATGAAGHAASIGILAGNDGSSAVHFGDTDNDIIGRLLYNHTSSNTADYFEFWLQGSRRFRIQGNGNLCIGNDSNFTAGAKVEIRDTIGGGGGTGLILNDISSSGANEGLYIEWRSGTDKQSDQCRIGQSSNNTGSGSNFFIATNSGDTGSSTERLRIDSAGRFLKGLTNKGASRSSTSVRYPHFQLSSPWSSGLGSYKIECTDDYPIIFLDSNASFANGAGAGVVTWSVKDGSGDYCNTASIRSQIDATPSNDSAPGRLQFQTTTSGASPTTKMTIDSGGSVNKPLNPAFYAYLTANNAVYTSGTTIPWANTRIDTRSAFQTSGSDQGRYIIPTTGIYYFGWRLNRRDDSRFDLGIYKNGTVQYIDEMRTDYNSNNWQAESGHYLISCTAGQKIDLRIFSVTNAGSGQFDGGGNGYYDAFFGWMVG